MTPAPDTAQDTAPHDAAMAAPAASSGGHGLVIVGGGVQGVTLALEAARRGLSPVLLERDRIGGATSAAWYRILHGGFRYLQSLDLVRTRESSAERRRFLGFAPDLVRPHPFLLPLHGEGLKRPAALRAAFALERMVTPDRNRGLPPDRRIGPGRVLSPDAARRVYPAIRTEGLKGAALWQDAVASDEGRLLDRLRETAVAAGARLVEGAEATALLSDDGRVAGVGTADGRTWRAPRVVNAAGPWSAEVAARFGVPAPELFRPALAFNLLLDRPPLSDAGLGVSVPGRPGAPTLFLMPMDGLTFAGTWYAPRTALDPVPTEAEIDAFLAELDAAAPALGATRRDVVRVFAGLQPATAPGGTDIGDRPVVVNHGAAGGPRGAWSLSGVKWTTAWRVSSGLLDRIVSDP